MNDGPFSRACQLRDSGDTPAAILEFEAALARNPESPGGWAALGQLLKEQNRMAEAIDAFQRAVALRPHKDIFAAALFFALLGARRFDEAMAEARRFLALIAAHGVECADDLKESFENMVADPEMFREHWNDTVAK